MIIQYIEQQNEHIKSLRERIRNFEEHTDNGISKEREVSRRYCRQLGTFTNVFTQLELQRIIDGQTRELALMSSAWFDLQCRIQTNNVTLSRYRHGSSMAEAQKGWLPRQRSGVATSR